MKPLSLLLTTALTFLSLSASAQTATLLKQENMGKWNIPHANYSGITHIEDNSYAVVSDKESKSGFYILNIDINPRNGKIRNVSRGPLLAADSSSYGRDEEGICFFPQNQSVFISAEDDQQILEYTLEGLPTGRRLNIPPMFSTDSIYANCGFESLTYSDTLAKFYAATERPLRRDAQTSPDLIRIIEFNPDLTCTAQYAYTLEPAMLNSSAALYVHGISEITSLPDGRLVVMEREASMPAGHLGAECRIRLFIVDPREGQPIGNETKPLYKTAIADFSTHLEVGRLNFANYEGMCPGPTLSNGRQTLILISDSQAGAGNSLFRLKDYIKVIVL